MKNSKKFLSYCLSFLMVAACFVPCLPAAAAKSAEEIVPVLFQSATEPAKVPQGYSYCGIMEEKGGKTVFFVELPASGSGLINGIWIDENGNEVDSPYLQETEKGIVKADPLPESYDSRTYNLITPVEYQIGGTCWAHAAVACMEANAIQKGYGTNEEIDLSEYHLAYNGNYCYYEGQTDSKNDGINRNTDALTILTSGGNYAYACRALKAYASAVYESHFPALHAISASSASDEKAKTDMAAAMADTFNFSNRFLSDIRLKECTELEQNVSTIKQAVMDYGAVQISYYSGGPYYNFKNYDKNSYWDAADLYPLAFYSPIKHDTDHAVTIVGWDDSFSKENFLTGTQPSYNGAWLIKNSWGSNWGNNGYFWISYEDKTLDTPVVYEVEDKNSFDNAYLYDGYADYYSWVSGFTAQANVFTSQQDEVLDKITFGLEETCPYTLEIYQLNADYKNPVDGTLLYTQSGSLNNSKEIQITGKVYLESGTVFSVVVKSSEPSNFKSISESKGTDNVHTTFHQKESYMLYRANWYDEATEIPVKYGDGSTVGILGNAKIRAFTKDVTKYTVTFSCGENVIASKTFFGSTVDLPSETGYTFVFENDFDGTGVTDNMTVTTHKYLTDGVKTKCTTEYKCVYCDSSVKDPVTEHTFTAETVDGKYLKSSATCAQAAQYYKSCAVCGESSKDTAGEATFTTGNPANHDYGDWTYDNNKASHTKVCANDASHTVTENCSFSSNVTKKPTCIAKGETVYTCSVCQGSYTEEIPTTAHSFITYVPNGDATCLADGNETATCENCNATTTRTQVGSMLSHDYTGAARCNNDGTHSFLCKNGCEQYGATSDCNLDKWETTKAPTIFEKGSETATCPECGYKQSREIAVLASTKVENNETGIQVSFGGDAYTDANIEVIVDKIEKDNDTYAIAQLRGFSACLGFDISTLLDGVKTEPEAPVIVDIPLPESFDEQTTVVWHYTNATTGQKEKITDFCVVEGILEFTTENLGVYVIANSKSEIGHNYIITSQIDATCKTTGSISKYCEYCDDQVNEVIALADHKANENMRCVWCGIDLSPSANCPCKCHKTSFFAKLFWKITNFFNKLFKINQDCQCGVKHW